MFKTMELCEVTEEVSKRTKFWGQSAESCWHLHIKGLWDLPKETEAEWGHRKTRSGWYPRTWVGRAFWEGADDTLC